MKSKTSATTPYQIKVQGHLGVHWSDYFDPMTMKVESCVDGDPITVLTGPVSDQAALRGILSRLWDMNLAVISVIRLKNESGYE